MEWQMQLGIIGFPSSGKTTLFNILTNSDLPVGEGSGGTKVEFTTAVAHVPEPRLETLGQLLKPEKMTFAQISFSDVGGLNVQDRRAGLPASLLNQLAPVDGLIHVVRAFESDVIPHMAGSVDHQRDVFEMETDLILNDLMFIERKLERLDEERGKGARDKSDIQIERSLFEGMHAHLSQDKALRLFEFSSDDNRLLSGYGLLSRKPLLIILNHSEGEVPRLQSQPEGTKTINLRGRLELELGQLNPNEAKEFREEYGLLEPAQDLIIRAAYDLLSIISFFTFNESELRAWALRQGGSALDAAESIHSDIARGFIRAEVIAWGDLVNLGGLSQARSAGELRVEGKNYIVKDGEMIYIRFNI
jgi:GTP-binding protein YchF